MKRAVVRNAAALACAACAHAEPQTIVLPHDPARCGPGVPEFSVRPGYKVTLAAGDIENARFMEFGDDGALYLSRPDRGDILVMRDANKDGVYEENERQTFVSGHRTVQGMCFRDGWLWCAESTGIFRARDDDHDGKPDKVETIIERGKLPGGTGHWWRPMLVGPDRFYTSIGDSGNITDEVRSERQKMFSFKLDGSGKELFASGIRNTEKYRFRPVLAPDGASTVMTAEIWGVDHGSDEFGKEYGDKIASKVTDVWPPDEFNHYEEGKFYGHPFITARGIPRLEHRYADNIKDYATKNTPPGWEFGAHWAANGWTFVAKPYFGAERVGDAFVALHGSWNSSVKVGYGVQLVLWDKVTGVPYGAQRIVNTLSPDGSKVLARPADCAEAPDGTILFTSDTNGAVYRISKEH